MRIRWWSIAVMAAGAAITAAFWSLGPALPLGAAAPREAPLPEARLVAQAQVVPIDGIIDVRPLAEGKVLRVLVQPGERVAANQLLAEIENDLESAAVRQRRAERGAAGERLALTHEGLRPEEQAALAAAADAARHEAALARDRWQRQQRLLAQGYVSEQSVVEAQNSLQAADARARQAEMHAQAALAGGRAGEVRAAQDALASAGAALRQGEVALARTRIVAPVAGVIMARNVDPGDIIGPNATAPTLFRIVDPARLEIRFEVEDLLAPHLELGLPVDFTLPGSKTILGRGKVTRIAPQVEKRSIGADDARIRADSMVRPAWSDFVAAAGVPPLPVSYRLEAWIRLKNPDAQGGRAAPPDRAD